MTPPSQAAAAASPGKGSASSGKAFSGKAFSGERPGEKGSPPGKEVAPPRWTGRGRPLARRLRVRGWLRLETPLHVGGLAVDPTVDLALAVDGRSRLYVPGTSLAGAMRAATERAFGAEAARLAWGHVPRGASDAGWASRILVGDGLLTASPGGAPLPPELVEARFGNGIDRHLGTVAENFLYGRAVVPRGAYLRLSLDLESAAASWDDDPAEEMVTRLLRSLLDGEVRLGAARTRGLGRVRLEASPLEIVDQDLTSLDGLLAAIGALPEGGGSASASGSAGPSRPDGAAGPAAGATGGMTGRTTGRHATRRRTVDELPDQGLVTDLVTVEVSWHPLSPVMVRAAVDGFDTKGLPLVSAVLDASDGGHGDDGASGKRASGERAAGGGAAGDGADGEGPAVVVPRVAPVLPGSSIKGALRTRAELIVRTVLGRDAPLPTARASQQEPALSKIFRSQLEELDVVRALFGSAGSTDPAGSGPDGPPWGRGALGVDDCYARTPVPPEVWQELLGRPRPAARNGAAARRTVGPGPSGPAGGPAPEQLAHKELVELLNVLDSRYGMARADHVAIDRWTGGAADGRLYSTLEPCRVEWEPIRITLDEHRLRCFDPALADAARLLFLLVLRELAAGRVRIGHAVNRGHGDIQADSVVVRGFGGSDRTTLADLVSSPAAADLVLRWREYVAHARTAPTTGRPDGQPGGAADRPAGGAR